MQDENLEIDGHTVKIAYAKIDNPGALEDMRLLLEKSIFAPKNDAKFDNSEEK